MRSLSKNVLPEGLWDILERIMASQPFHGFYLAGGTGLALQLGHRRSDDLDLFTQVEFRSNLVAHLKDHYEVISQFDNSIELFIEKNKVFFFYFGYPLHYLVKKIENIRLADPRDIGLMKLLALQGRTTRKDIVDLYFIDKEVIKLEALLEIFETAFPGDSFNSYSSLKQLINIQELDEQPMPQMLKPVAWEQASGLVLDKVARYMDRLLLKHD